MRTLKLFSCALFFIVSTVAMAQHDLPNSKIGSEAAKPPSGASQNSGAPNFGQREPNVGAEVKIAAKPRATPEPLEQKKSDTRDYWAPEWAIVWATCALVGVTLGLAIYTGGLYKATVILGKDAKASGDRQAEATAKQIAILAAQTDIIEKQHAIGRLQFLAEHRPRLQIRNITIIRPDDGSQRGAPIFRDGQPIYGSLVVVNTGETEARIVDSLYRFYWSDMGLPMDPPTAKDKVLRFPANFGYFQESL